MTINAENISWYHSPCEIDVSFSFLSTSVASTHQMTGFGCETPPAKHGYVVIRTVVTVEEFDSAGEAGRYARPSELVVLGILSFLTKTHFSVYQKVATHKAKAPFVEGHQSGHTVQVAPKLFVEGSDNSKDLAVLLAFIGAHPEHETNLLFSLLDRWRRAQYLLLESDAGLHHEEAFLGFFHVLELLSTEYGNQQQAEAKEKLTGFLRELLASTFLLRGPRLESEANALDDGLRKLMLSQGTFGAATRILYLMQQLGLLDVRTQSLVEELVKARNAIAHGRTTYRKGLVWPVPAFFPLLSQHSDLVETLEVLAARVIACHYELSSWEREWDGLVESLNPPTDIVRDFIVKQRMTSLSRADFEAGVSEHVRPESVVAAVLAGKIKLPAVEGALKDYIMAIEDTETLSSGLAIGLVLLADAADPLLRMKCRKLVRQLSEDNFGVSNIKDVLRVLEDRGVRLSWFRSYLDGGDPTGVNS